MVSLWTFFSLVGGEPTSGSNYTGVYALMGNISLISPTWQEFQYLQNSSKVLFYMSLYREPGRWSKAVLLPLNCFSLVWASPPFPNQQLLELRKGGWMKPIFCNQGTGDTERLLCSGIPQDPAQYHSLPFLPLRFHIGVEVGRGRNILPSQWGSDNRQTLTPHWIYFFYVDLCFSLLFFCL